MEYLTFLKLPKMTYNLYLNKVRKMNHNRDLPKASKIQKNTKIQNFFKAIAKIRGSKDYKSMSEDGILSALKDSDSLKESEKNFDDTKTKIIFSKPRTEKIRKEFNESRHKFSKSKINDIRRNLHEIEN